jgi:hypothetical protein
MSTKIPYEQMVFYYEIAVNKALEKLFSEDAEHGWTKEEFDKMLYEEALRNALQGREHVVH